MLRRLKDNPGLLAGFFAQALQYGAGLILMPFVVSRLSVAEVGIWYVFLAVQSLATVADFGFQPTFARFFSLAHSGVPALAREGITVAGDGTPNVALTRSLLSVARRLYLILALATLALLCVFGTPYVSNLAKVGEIDVGYIRASWLLFASAVAVTLYFMWIPAFLLGSSKVASNYFYLIFSRGGFALFGIVVLLAGGGLLALAAGFLASQLVARLTAVAMLRGTTATGTQPGTREETRIVLAAVWPNASRLGLVAIGAFFITRYNIFLLSSTLGLKASASYGICFQLLSGISSVGQLPIQASLAKVVSARVTGDTARFRRLIAGSAAFYGAIYILGAGIVILGGDMLLALIGSRVELLPRATLAVFAIVIALEGFHSMAAFVITTRNAVPFVLPALLSGVAVAVSTTAAVKLGYGVAGVVICQGLVQLAYNNWKWPLMVYREWRA